MRMLLLYYGENKMFKAFMGDVNNVNVNGKC